MYFKNIKGTSLSSFFSRIAKLCSSLFHISYNWGILLFGTRLHFVFFMLLLLVLYVEFTMQVNEIVECIMLGFTAYVLLYMVLTIVLLQISKRRHKKESEIITTVLSVNKHKKLDFIDVRLSKLKIALELLLSACGNNVDKENIKVIWASTFGPDVSFDDCLNILLNKASSNKPVDVPSLIKIVNSEVIPNIDSVLSNYGVSTGTVWFPKIYTDKYIYLFYDKINKFFKFFKRKKLKLQSNINSSVTKAYNCAMYDIIMLNTNRAGVLVDKIDSIKSTWLTTLCHEYIHIFIKDELVTSLLAANLMTKSNNVYVLLSLINSLKTAIFYSKMKVNSVSEKKQKKVEKSIESYAHYVYYYEFGEFFDNPIIQEIEGRMKHSHEEG